MRWKNKVKENDRPPKNGDGRILKKFAWTLTKVENNTVWLETYFVREEFINGMWIEISKELACWMY